MNKYVPEIRLAKLNPLYKLLEIPMNVASGEIMKFRRDYRYPACNNKERFQKKSQ
jgi:hypothetical protein